MILGADRTDTAYVRLAKEEAIRTEHVWGSRQS